MKDEVEIQVQAPEVVERNECIDEVVATLGANYRALRTFRTGK